MRNLTKWILAMLPGLALVGFSGCIERDNRDFPESVTFFKDGGRMEFHGEGTALFTHIEISDYDGNSNYNNWSNIDSPADFDTLSVTYEWLTAKTVLNQNVLILEAKPSDNNKKRTLYFRSSEGNSYLEIKVTQK